MLMLRLKYFNFRVGTALVLLALVFFSRLIAFWIFDRWDVVNDSGVAIKPLGEPAYLDYAGYQSCIGSAWSEIFRPIVFGQYALINVSEALSWLRAQNIKPGPIFPELLDAWGYERNRAPLSYAYLVFGGVLGWLWAILLAWRKMGLWMQALVACFPAMVYYSFLVSTDLLYAVLIAIFYATAWAVLLRKSGALIWCIVALVVAVLSRPNALAMIPVLFVVIAFEATLRWPIKLILSTILGLFGLYMLIYYMPYYWVHEGNSVHTHYWGIFPHQFHVGIFSGLPKWLNQAFSLLLLATSKVIYSVGLRPSYAELSSWLVLARAWPGVLLLPGLIYGLWQGHWFDRTFIFFFMLPVYVGAAQERYLLAITPLLLMWGVKAYSAIWHRCMHRNTVKVTL